MNDYMIYETAKLRHAELVEEVSRMRMARSAGHRNSRTRARNGARQRFAIVTQAFTSRTRAPKAA